jgi:hypothetical protein
MATAESPYLFYATGGYGSELMMMVHILGKLFRAVNVSDSGLEERMQKEGAKTPAQRSPEVIRPSPATSA